MPLDTLHELFVHELRDLHDAELQLLQALPLLAQAASGERLKELFEKHLEETEEQVRRLADIFRALGVPPTGKTCLAMQGLVAEARETIQEEADPQVLDAALIVAAQKVEHYEICGYGSVRTFARDLGYTEVVRMLEKTLREETHTDEKLTRLAESRVNKDAAVADEAKV